ncbi:unnamed protein product [Lactuca virosa]|uniref:Uncharacterized protein n=1 Tax=Lactuca virosa TaxID=75947 RepID=A0AAU9PPE1_9ASTR|nr:unnamed protein product [Lactuca virosa]
MVVVDGLSGNRVNKDERSVNDTNHRRPYHQRYSSDFPPPARLPLFTSATFSSVHFCYRHLRSPMNHQICIRSDLIKSDFIRSTRNLTGSTSDRDLETATTNQI